MRNIHLIFVLATSLLPFATTQAAPADLPKTGQTTCYDATGAVIACTGTGQDGELKAGMVWPNPRFVVGTGTATSCVTDTLTGLMWVRTPNTTATWNNALINANGLSLCGFTDWRLPNINELKSLVNSEAANPSAFLNAQGFSGVAGDRYWSSTTSAANPTVLAWQVDMSSGRLDGTPKTDSIYVWPVRAGQ